MVSLFLKDAAKRVIYLNAAKKIINYFCFSSAFSARKTCIIQIFFVTLQL